jgi:ketosteroid isomerase-like protein
VTFLFFLLLLAPDQRADLKADLKSIEELHRKEVAATKIYDVATLTALWTEDVVAMPPNGQPIIGKAANHDFLAAGEAQTKLVDIMDFAQKWEEVTVSGDYAFEWGTFRSQITVKANAISSKAEFKVMRILKRQPDGTWKIHRTIWNEIPPAPPEIQAAPALQPKKP